MAPGSHASFAGPPTVAQGTGHPENTALSLLPRPVKTFQSILVRGSTAPHRQRGVVCWGAGPPSHPREVRGLGYSLLLLGQALSIPSAILVFLDTHLNRCVKADEQNVSCLIVCWFDLWLHNISTNGVNVPFACCVGSRCHP